MNFSCFSHHHHYHHHLTSFTFLINMNNCFSSYGLTNFLSTYYYNYVISFKFYSFSMKNKSHTGRVVKKKEIDSWTHFSFVSLISAKHDKMSRKKKREIYISSGLFFRLLILGCCEGGGQEKEKEEKGSRHFHNEFFTNFHNWVITSQVISGCGELWVNEKIDLFLLSKISSLVFHQNLKSAHLLLTLFTRRSRKHGKWALKIPEW